MNADSDPGRSPMVRIEPDASEQIQLARSFFETARRDERARQFRDELALPLDRPIIMTGHQASWFHPGILAKYIACDALAQSVGGAAAWVTPDQDEETFTTIGAPTRTHGRLSREEISLARPMPGAPAAFYPPLPPDRAKLSGDPALRSVEHGLDRLRKALQRHAHEAGAPRQVTESVADLMSALIPRAPILYASQLAQTTLFAELIDQLCEEAHEATAAYNDAVARLPEARVAPLMRAPGRDLYELPLWRLKPGAPRQSVFAHEVRSIPLDELAPKALFYTGLLRLGACDLFIHGTGGGSYDRITERWFEQWLGARLAPMLMVTATMMLPLANEAPTERDIRKARWRAHHARHHPAVLGDDAAQRRRDEFARTVAAAKDNGSDASAAYRALHDFLDAYRLERRSELNELERTAADLRSRLGEAELASDRTWPFFYFEPESLTALANAVRNALGAPTEPERIA